MDDRIPPFLTVEEASRLLRIGRTKAYLLTQEWRATGGRSGLPVVDLGDVLRVPGPAIEKMLGTGLAEAAPVIQPGTAQRRSAPPAPAAPSPPGEPDAEAPQAEPSHATEAPHAELDAPSAATVQTRRPSRASRRSPDQLPLFQPLSPSSPDPHSPSSDDSRSTPRP